MVAGPCAVETEAQCMAVAELLKPTECGCFVAAHTNRVLPRTAFQGLGEPGLKILAKVRETFGFGNHYRSESTTNLWT